MIQKTLHKHRFISMKWGSGELDVFQGGREVMGGKADGLLSIYHTLAQLTPAELDGIEVDIPAMTVLDVSVFDAFMERNELKEIAISDLPDDRIAYAFQQGDMPFEVLGDLRELVNRLSTPLAVRSSGLLEDTTHRPFAGVYLTKMIPNHFHDPDLRFRKLIEAVKFVWASTYFKIAKDYCLATSLDICDEKMAVIIQEMVGKRHGTRFYPELSGVMRSYNYYPFNPAKPEDGVVDLALGLGKTIVDGDKTWSYSPAYPQMPPPFESVQELLKETQIEFWAVNLGEPPEYNPIRETEYLVKDHLVTAERDGVLPYLVSTYDPQSERLSIGMGTPGARALTFAPLLSINDIALNPLIKTLLEKCEQSQGEPVEIEFAMTFDPPSFGFLQVRPMVVPGGGTEISAQDMKNERAVVASEMALGNGMVEDICDIVYIMPEKFSLEHTSKIALELEQVNHALLEAHRPYLLIVFGRLGTFDPWLGIPVSWGQICGAKVIVEATQHNVRVELSQGSHYFHNITNLGVMYFSMPFTSPYRVNWDWLKQQPVTQKGEFVRHVSLPSALTIKVDGKHGRGLILYAD